MTFDKEGHRGCRGLMPENTIPAMLHAVELGVTTLEMDAVITKDGQVILSHEPFFNHEITTKPDGHFIREEEEKKYNIFQMTYAETKGYDVGLKPHPRFPQQVKMAVHKPLLSDVIDSVEGYCRQHHIHPPQYNIETKSMPASDGIYHPAPDVFVETLIQVILQKNITNRVIIQSFDFRTLRYLHQHYPQFKTAMLIEDFDKRNFKDQLLDVGFTPTIYSPEASLATKERIEECHQVKMKVIPWTVDDPALMKQLIKDGVDGIISDYPNLFSIVK